MKSHLAWIRHVAAAAIVAGGVVASAEAQYVPYQPSQPSVSPAPVSPYGTMWQQTSTATSTAPVQAPTALPAPVQTPVTSAPTASQVSTYPQTTAPYVPAASAYSNPIAPQSAYPTAATQQSAYPQVGYPQMATQYPAAYQSRSYLARQPNGELPTPPAPQSGANGAPVESSVVNGVPGQPTPASGDIYAAPNGYPAANGMYANTADCGCNQGYPKSDISGYFDNPCYQSVWFGGAYYLFMTRESGNDVRLTAEVDHATMPDPYYPQAAQTRLYAPEDDFRSGVEIRFGSTFSVGDSCDPCSSCGTGGYGACGGAGCGCAPCNYDVFAWEFGAWALDDDDQQFTWVNGIYNTYGMQDFSGIQYDRNNDGTWRPVNEYYGYGLPVTDPNPYAVGDIMVLAQRVRTSFDCQNLELNFMRLPLCNTACGGGCGSSGCGDCGGCETDCCPIVFSSYGSCGVRYFRVDDSFLYCSEFAEMTGGGWDSTYDGFTYDDINEIMYNVRVDNQLIGPQLGWMMNYCVGCRWNFFANSTFGVFNNHINARQRVWGGGDGVVRFTSDPGQEMNVRSSKNDIAFLGELRLGMGYDVTCNCRAVLAYRALGLSGLATSASQVTSDFTNYYEVAQIDSDNSMIIHGLQAGVECRY